MRKAIIVSLVVQTQCLETTSRRRALAWPAALVGALPGSALAFENAIPESVKYADRTKRKGPEPKDLGVRTTR